MAMVTDAVAGMLIEKLGDLAIRKIGQMLGVKKELNTLQSNMKWIETIIKDSKRNRNHDGVSKLYRAELADWMYDAEDIIEECEMHGSKLLEDRYAPSLCLTVCNLSMAFSCFGSVPFRHKIGSKIKGLNDRLDQITKNKNRFIGEGSKLQSQPSRMIDRETTPFNNQDEFIGSEIENNTKKLINFISKENKEGVSVIVICGMGGIGKSTLAKKLYDTQIVKTFEKKAWVFVSPNCTNVDVLKKTIEHVGDKKPESENKAILQNTLISKIVGKSFFLVLDDVWSDDIWENALKTPLQKASRVIVLVTTRDGKIAERMRAIHNISVKPLSINSGWELLCKSAYLIGSDVENLRDIGNKIVDKCEGLPLAIKVIGGVLSGKERTRKEWEIVLNSDTWMKTKEFEGPLLLSYEDLNPQLQQCFLYCSLFPKGILWQRYLVMYWVAEGFIQAQEDMIMEEVAEKYYFELIRRNLLQSHSTIDNTKCTMHDLLRSLAQSLSEGQSFCCDAQKLVTTDISKFRRLSIVGGDEAVTIPSPNDEKLRLRTFMLFQSFPKIEFHMLERLESLRALMLNEEGVKTIPESLEKLKFLRLLDLDRTSIRHLPESIGSLVKLEILNLQGCRCLESLPKGLTKLCNLRRLDIRETPLISVPKGIGSLKQLNDLQGFIVAHSSSRKRENNGWDLKELEALNNLRCLLVDKVERQVCDVQVLKEKHHLRELHLYCTPMEERNSEQPFIDEEFYKVERIFQNMSPPSCLDILYMRFFGRKYPKWIENLSHLTFLSLEDCINSFVLPPLGQLPKLKRLFIKNAREVVSIGSEFTGNEDVAFPKLEYFFIKTMPNWEIWSLAIDRIEQGDGAQEDGVGTSHSLSLFPSLNRLIVEDCPKLSALPKELNKATKLMNLRIDGALSLMAVQELPSILTLEIDNCSSLQKVSNLPQLKELYIYECPILRCIENMNCLRLLGLYDFNLESLPKGLTEIANSQQNLDDANTELILYCNRALFMRCLEGEEEWPIIQQFSSASINTLSGDDTWIFIEYNKLMQTYKTNYWDIFTSE